MDLGREIAAIEEEQLVVEVVELKVDESQNGRDDYYAVFESDSDKRIGLKLSPTDYFSLTVGDRGTLTYWCGLFKRFEAI